MSGSGIRKQDGNVRMHVRAIVVILVPSSVRACVLLLSPPTYGINHESKLRDRCLNEQDGHIVVYRALDGNVLTPQGRQMLRVPVKCDTKLVAQES